ncbi:MAG: MFS transporter [Candidatus Sumerlaeota bacterium]
MPQIKPNALGREEFNRHWRTVTIAGALGSIWMTFCLVGMARQKFLQELGAESQHFGILASLLSLTQVAQVFGGLICRRIRRRKAIWMALIIIHRTLFFAVLAAPFLFDTTMGKLGWAFAVLFVHDLLMQIGGPLWVSWMADLLPPGSFNRDWGSRQRVTTFARILGQLAIVFIFGWFEENDMIIAGYWLIGSAGVVLGVIDIAMFHSVPEPPNEVEGRRASFQTLIEPLRNSEFRPYIAFRAVYQIGVAMFAPFIAIFMFDVLLIPAWMAEVLAIVSTLTLALSSRIWGTLCDTYGKKPVLQTVILGKCIIPLTFCLAPRESSFMVPILILGFGFDGIMNGALILIMQSYVMQNAPRRNRAMYVAATNLLSAGIVMMVVPVLAGYMIKWIGETPWNLGPWVLGGYQISFAISIAIRLLSVPLTHRLREPGALPVRQMLSDLTETNLFLLLRDTKRLATARQTGRRVRAARRLGRLRSPLAIGELLRALEDPQRSVRHAAAAALGRIGNSEATEKLAELLVDRESGVQSPAARALGRIGDERSLSALLENLSDADEITLHQSLEALRRIKNPAAILPLICLYEDIKIPAVKRQIADVLSDHVPDASPQAIMMTLGPRGRTRPNT